ncbi:MAG TPA: serine hydrolase domain-containing protein [Thermoanaerobaculia bacterium]|nr:serine hydrolase domain-containing protein [Thermoanaerobaculia bacterium]
MQRDSELARRLQRFLEDDVVEGAAFTAAVVAVSRTGLRMATAVAGWRDPEQRLSAQQSDLFDLASLTKPWVATLGVALDGDGVLPLETPLGEIWSQAPSHLAARTCEDLLRHRSGLRPWAPIYELCRDDRDVLEVLGHPDLAGAPHGTYSDLGYLLWRLLAERALGRSVAELLPTRLGPLAGGLRVAPVGGPGVVSCAMGTAREVELARELELEVPDLGPPTPGEAQDGNARFLGGLAGHAGLFAPIGTVLALGQAWLEPTSSPSPSECARALGGQGDFALGWWRRQPGGAGKAVFSPAAFGHTGFVGGSLWVDPERSLVVAMLGHRRDPFLDLAPLRAKLHRLVIEDQP